MTRGALVLALLGACDGRQDLVIDAGELAALHPDALLVVDVVLLGEVVDHAELDLAQQTELTMTDAITGAVPNGVVAFADVDGDGICTFEADLTWRFVYEAGRGETLTWSPDPEVFRDASACVDFSGQTFR